MYRTVARQGADTQNEDVFISEALKNPHQDRPPTYPEAPITTKAVRTDGSQARPSAVRPLQAIEDGHSNLIGNRGHARNPKHILPTHSSLRKPGPNEAEAHTGAHRSILSSDSSEGNTDKTHEQTPRSRTFELLVAFGLIFIPMSLVAFVLIGFVYYPKDRLRFDRGMNGTLELPATGMPPYDAYYTTLSAGRFLLLASWASTWAGVVVAPFMLLFSFVVARELTRFYRRKPPERDHDSHLLREILGGSWGGLLHWAKHILGWAGYITSRTLGRESQPPKAFVEKRATHIAALALCVTGFLS